MIILIVYDNRGVAMVPLAQAIAKGAETVDGSQVWLRTVDEATAEELSQCDALVLGSPNWSGMTAKMKDWLDSGEDFWEKKLLVGKVGAAFTSSRFRSAGNEQTLLQLIHLLMANGMFPVGLPWDHKMRVSSASYYGAASVGQPTEDDLALAEALGARVAEAAKRIKRSELGEF